MKIWFSEAFVIWPFRGFTFCDEHPGGDEEFPESYEINLYKNNNYTILCCLSIDSILRKGVSESMKNIRIGMFSWESLYSIRIGGISPHVSELSEALAAEGHEVHLFTRGRENSDEIINGVYYHRVA
jgi:hypothetical protein